MKKLGAFSRFERKAKAASQAAMDRNLLEVTIPRLEQPYRTVNQAADRSRTSPPAAAPD